MVQVKASANCYKRFLFGTLIYYMYSKVYIVYCVYHQHLNNITINKVHK